MFRRAFLKIGGSLSGDSARSAVPPCSPSRRKDALLLAFLLSAPIAAGSPLTTSPVGFSGTNSDFLPPSLVAGVMRMEGQEIRSRSELLPASFASPPPIDEVSAQGIHGGLTSAGEEQSYEGYPYLLLTAGLILLAFRPANPAAAGRV